ncbi:MAG: prepilin-type N-terminal cleavage/methylation domain-containing protein [Candidatus Omnitrophica bacterium]|nr:prepilin-type N-terminal cleavage/methylation domain-containing protein [Candidatus Omnitrophota bacterium]MDD5552992.1 prepilin-type N-terminal cleavage/methylation domain-containing protein [Candidatus Omnitrophota bacterium]
MRKGFTLLELIIVVIIIGLLATVGIGQYTKAIANAKNSQAKAVLGEMRKAAFAYQSLNGSWPTDAADPVDIAVDLDNDGTNDVNFRTPTVADFTFTSDGAAGRGQAAKSGTAGSGVSNWRIDYQSGTISSY